MKVNDSTIYLGDNGHAYCGAHLGMTAQMTGRDLSGQPILAVTPEIAREMNEDLAGYGLRLACETCGREPSLLYTAV